LRSQVTARTWEPEALRSRDPEGFRARTPESPRSRAPGAFRSRAPEGFRPRTSESPRSRAPEGSRSRAPEGSRSRSPEGFRPRTSESPRSRAPEGFRSRAPEGFRSRAPEGSRFRDSESPRPTRSSRTPGYSPLRAPESSRPKFAESPRPEALESSPVQAPESSEAQILELARPRVQIKPETPELLHYGWHACMALFEHRKEDLIRAYVVESLIKDFSIVLKHCATEKKAYHVVSPEELETITGSVHHEGVAILAKRQKVWAEQELLTALELKAEPLVILDHVKNPHNIGSVMRIMAHFGWKHLLTSKESNLQVSASMARMSEGGSELVNLTFFEDETELVQNLKKIGYKLLGSSSRAKTSLYETKLPYPAVAFFLGNEVSGLSKSLGLKLDTTLRIPSSGLVQSLNVAMSSSLLLGECVRQHGLGQHEPS
ncbi:MAG: hypothetical protein KA436_07460, partial [Oligoflexales bacterium]|nr:hypothetical protein [Oligoflexales bacterium]